MMIKLITIILIILLVFILYRNHRQSQQSLRTPYMHPSAHKPLIVLVIDSLMDLPLQETVSLGQAPALHFLQKKGEYYPKVVSSFPTMSVSIDSTLLTGTPPNQHHIYGLSYYHPSEKRVVNFGTGARESLKFGVRTVLQDSLQHYNQHYLSSRVSTIHEDYPEDTASINALLYRGNQSLDLYAPWLAQFLGLMPKKIPARVPALFSFGVFARLAKASKPKHLWSRYGLNDRFARMELISLIKQKQLPAFSIVYLPQNDDAVHAKGPQEIKGIKKVDKELQAILEAFGSWDDALQKANFIIMGDSGQTHMIPNHKSAYIDLRTLLQTYKIMPIAQQSPQPSDQLILCVNERMAYIYILDQQVSLAEIVSHLQKEERIDIIAWRQEERIHVTNHLNTQVQYQAKGKYCDEYDQTWEIEGDLTLLDIHVVNQNQLTYGEYPDVLSRLAGVMDNYTPMIVMTAAAGYELVGEASPTHVGGSHGSLHYMDSYVPMIVTGHLPPPPKLRLIDFKAWWLSLYKTNDD
ncbi:alkaline phosphatase family protein [Hazenella sp. IB182353]|uniref:alkaline phosphatase family protein n=1 Tax=Polycladospora coralii TaxID=2771432 RepID=UPI0017467E78|nr:alkaline phosphatase family protein [Polycladospora coralii]MBS7529382.1 alkaline phosphatase family protein [Polycladospora coralii]